MRKARSTYAAALTASNGDPGLVLRWVRRETAAGHLRHALRIVESALVRHPDHPELEQVQLAVRCLDSHVLLNQPQNPCLLHDGLS